MGGRLISTRPPAARAPPGALGERSRRLSTLGLQPRWPRFWLLGGRVWLASLAPRGRIRRSISQLSSSCSTAVRGCCHDCRPRSISARRARSGWVVRDLELVRNGGVEAELPLLAHRSPTAPLRPYACTGNVLGLLFGVHWTRSEAAVTLRSARELQAPSSAIASRARARRTARARIARRAPVSRQRRIGRGLSGRGSILRALRLFDHVPAPGRAARDRAHCVGPVLDSARAAPVPRIALSDARGGHLRTLFCTHGRAACRARASARRAGVRCQLASHFPPPELLAAVRGAFAAGAHLEPVDRRTVLRGLAVVGQPRAATAHASHAARRVSGLQRAVDGSDAVLVRSE